MGKKKGFSSDVCFVYVTVLGGKVIVIQVDIKFFTRVYRQLNTEQNGA